METTVVLNTIFAGFVGQQAFEIVMEMLKLHILINCCLQVMVQGLCMSLWVTQSLQTQL